MYFYGLIMQLQNLENILPIKNGYRYRIGNNFKKNVQVKTVFTSSYMQSQRRQTFPRNKIIGNIVFISNLRLFQKVAPEHTVLYF